MFPDRDEESKQGGRRSFWAEQVLKMISQLVHIVQKIRKLFKSRNQASLSHPSRSFPCPVVPYSQTQPAASEPSPNQTKVSMVQARNCFH